MLRNLLLGVACVVLSAGATDPARRPVLVELFTSEGCSSCPPADRLLEKLDPLAIVLSEHVDYWDRLGWKDRFSSTAFTERQEAYAREFYLDSPFTPQMVVDGEAQFTGSDARQAGAEIDKAAAKPKTAILLERAGSSVRIKTDGPPHDADLWLALADNTDSTRVLAGENKGHTLDHVAVVRSLRKVGGVKRGKAFDRMVELPPDAAGRRIVVFLQESGPSHVLGAAMLPSQ